MQTFLAYDDLKESAAILDRNRLNKQRLEVRLILEELDERHPNTRWHNHPCVRMWRGHASFLGVYGIYICEEWLRRGYKDEQLAKITKLKDEGVFEQRAYVPSWFGDEDFHASHRSNLLRKNPEFYGQYGWAESPDLEYVWPVGGKSWPQPEKVTA